MATRVLYRAKLGTIPYANIDSPRPLVVGERVWVPETRDFKTVKPRFCRPTRDYTAWASCLVDRVDPDGIVFLTRH